MQYPKTHSTIIPMPHKIHTPYRKTKPLKPTQTKKNTKPKRTQTIKSTLSTKTKSKNLPRPYPLLLKKFLTLLCIKTKTVPRIKTHLFLQ